MPAQSSWSRERVGFLGEEQKIRVGLVLFVAFCLIVHPQSVIHTPSAYAAVLLMVASLLVSRFGIRRERLASAQRFEVSAVALSVIDLVAVTTLVLGTGGADSSFYPLYMLALVFAATFFRHLELALLTLMACLLYAGVCWPLATPEAAWLLTVRLGSIVLLAWCSYALSTVLHREKQGNDQLLRHLTEGVLVLDADNRVAMVSDAFRSMFGVANDELVGVRHDQVGEPNELLRWVLKDVGPEGGSGLRSTRTGGFPDYDLPELQVTTMSCGENGTNSGGWVVICKDLRDEPADSGGTDRELPDSMSPLTNLRALSQALYSLSGQLDEGERWRTISQIEAHTTAIKSLLSRSLQPSPDTDTFDTGLSLIDIRGLLGNTRRLLEIQNHGLTATIEVRCLGPVPPVRGDRGTLGRLVLRLAKAVLGLAQSADRVCVSAETDDGVVTLGFELAPPPGCVPPEVEDPDPPDASMAAEVGRAVRGLGTSLDGCEADWDYEPRGGRYFAVKLQLRLPQPDLGALEPDGEGNLVGPASEETLAAADDRLSPQTRNDINNSLSGIRGYAELALSWPQGEQLERVLAAAVGLCDRASEILEGIGGGTCQIGTAPLADLASLLPAGEASPSSPGQDRTILIADDDHNVREVLAELLGAAGYSVTVAGDGRTAIEHLLNGAAPAIAFVDLLMPGNSGLDVLRAARQHRPEVPVVIMSGCGEATLNEALSQIRSDRVLMKPFAFTDVWAITRDLLKLPADGAAGPAKPAE